MAVMGLFVFRCFAIRRSSLSNGNPNPYNNAYTEGKSIVTNAKYHRGQVKVLNVDIEKYFDSITQAKVEELFLNVGYNQDVTLPIFGLASGRFFKYKNSYFN